MTNLLIVGAPGSRTASVVDLVARTAAPGAVLSATTLEPAGRALLGRLGWTLEAPPAAPDPAARPDAVDVATLSDALASATPAHPEPATSGHADRHAVPGLLLPWWRRLLGDALVVVVVLDDPAAAAWRTALESDIEPEQALAAWLAWHRHVAAGTSGLPLVVVDPATFIDAAVRADLAARLAALGVAMAGPEATHVSAADPAPEPPAPPAGILRPELLVGAAALASGWRGPGIAVHAPAALTVPAPEPWETAVLAVGRRLVSARALHDRDRTTLVDAEARAAAAAALAEELSAAEERIADLDARLAAALEDAAVDAEARRALGADLEAQRTRSEELAARADALGSELSSAATREQALAIAHLDVTGSPVGRLGVRWARLAERVPPVRLADRAAESALLAVRHRPRILRPHPLFDAAWYLAQNDDVRAAGADPYRHYRKHGTHEGRRPDPFLDPDWYRSRYPDVRASGLDPIDHYHEHGWREGRDPGPEFDTGWYLRAYPDVLISGVDPLEHFLHHGLIEGRAPRGDGGPRWALGPGAASQPGSMAATAPAIGEGTGGQARGIGWTEAIAEALAALPAGAHALVAGDQAGDPPLAAGRRSGWLRITFPGRSGTPVLIADRTLTVRLEAARWAGMDHLLIHRDQAWWLERNPELQALLGRYRRVALEGLPVMAWRLTAGSRPSADTAEVLMTRIRRSAGHDPSVLAWGVSAASVETRLGGTAFEPPVEAEELPYLDGTIDVVVIGADAPARLEEARRVAIHAVLRVRGRGTLEPAWLAPRLGSPGRTAVALVGAPGRAPDAAAVRRIGDALIDEAVTELLVATPDEALALPPMPNGAPPARAVPVPPAASVAERAGTLAAAADADTIVVLDGSVLPVPGWLEPLVAALEADPALDATVPVLVTPEGRLIDGDHRDVGDSRHQVVRAVTTAPAALFAARRADLLRPAGTAADGAPSRLTLDRATVRFATGGRLEPASLAIAVTEVDA